MKYSHKLSDAIHILTYVQVFKDGDLSSRAIASSIETNPSLVRQLISLLSKAGLLNSHPGKSGLSLAKPATQISILDVYDALGHAPLLHIDPKTNVKCIVGGNIQSVLNQEYDEIQRAAERKMDEITIQDITNHILVLHQNRR
ncbi:transcriptional regulator [Philodulcilactobacillus myokoensis]|uniref:Transcriptional regulator n=1 Tax=Philodulcilactobacillus myokoensis TaxID=2929573 RepID=A0A9W6AZC2_9LACO|nr:Rrf2 family transcriptional regulator [Philodulcilactobacillus myokoensis]GLB46137.1 transcriptional regulator [Philodulcilactobacillus myokoensis]